MSGNVGYVENGGRERKSVHEREKGGERERIGVSSMGRECGVTSRLKEIYFLGQC